jgi:hypothetical protein
MINRSTVVRCARNAALIAAIVSSGAFVSAVFRGLGKRGSRSMPHAWLVGIALAALMFAVVFCLFFAWGLLTAVRAQPVDAILEQETPESELLRASLDGFVAMEFYWLILNRTFLVFVAPEGVYGWKASGPVTNSDRRYFEPFQEMVQDPGLMRDLPAIRKLAGLRGGFFYPRSEIVSITADDRGQWGMGGIAHTGHVQLRLVSGMTRKFILLGEVVPDAVRERMVATLGTGITSVV